MPSVGPYDLREPIGEGGMAQVFRALGPDGQEVAVKLLRGGGAASAEELARFEREIRIAEGMEHPHLIRVLDHGVDAERGPWLAMPLVRGMTLRDLFGKRTLSPEAALLLLHPMVEALAALHAQGLVHRDAKPENLMLSPMGDVTLVDLGLALGEADTRHTQEGEVAGSIPYMSPERIEGRDVDPSADVWAFGVMLYELVAGARPFARARATEEVAAILSGSFTPLAEADRRVGKELDWLVSVCLASDPWKRPKDGAALLERIRPMIFTELDKAREARVSVLSDVKAFERKLAPRVAEWVRSEAEARLREGDELEALRLLDRALAYVPDDEATLALVDSVTSGEVPTPSSVEGAPTEELSSRPAAKGSRLRWIGGALSVAALVSALVAAVGLWRSNSEPSVGSDQELHSDAQADAGVNEDPATVASSTQDAGSDAPPLEFHPIPPNLLSNDDPRDLGDSVAAPGERLVSRTAAGPDPERALREAVRALEDDPDDADNLARRAVAKLALGRVEEGMEELEALERSHGDEASVLAVLGFLAMRRGDVEEADLIFTRALARDPTHLRARRHRGVLRRRLGRTRDGYEDLVRVLAQDPDNLYALAEMTEVYQRAGRVADARPFLERMLERYPTSLEGWTGLSIALSASGEPADIERAVEAVERAVALDPEYVRAQRQRCILLSRHGRAGSAAACSEAIRRAPRDAQLFMARASGLAREGSYVAALADADRAVELAPEERRNYANRAILRGLSGDEVGAAADLRVACRLGDQGACSRLQLDGLTP